MLVTEEEAKTKRCQESFGDGNVTPQGHMVAVQMTGGAGYVIGTSPSMCIGSACMAWRWRGWLSHDDLVFGGSRPLDGCTHVGYCGKAGKP